MGPGRPWRGFVVSALLCSALALAVLGGCSRTHRASPEVARQVRDLWLQATALLQANMDQGFREANTVRAVGYLRQAEALAADDASLKAEIGRVYYYLQQVDDAERLLGEALASADLEPGSEGWIIANEMMGRLLEARGDPVAAEALIKNAADRVDELNRRDPGKYFGCPFQALGSLYSDMGRVEEAAQLFQKAAEAESPKGSTQYEAAAHSLVAGDLTAAGRYARRALALHRLPVDGARAAWLLAYAEQARRSVRAGGPPPSRPVARLVVALLDELVPLALELADTLSPVERGRLVPDQPYGDTSPDASARTRAVKTERVQRVADLLVEDLLQNEVATVATVADALLAIPEPELGIDNRAGLRLLSGFAALVRQDYDRAEALFAEAAADPATRDGGLVGRGHLAIVRHDPDAADRLLTPVVAAGDARLAAAAPGVAPAAFDWLVYRMACLGLAWSAANQNRHEVALSHYDRILAVRSDDGLALLGKGNSLSGLGRMDDAEVLFKRVLATDPENPFALAELGLVDYNRGRIDDAEASFKRALANDNDRYTCPYEGLGLVYLRQGRLAEARRNFQKSIEINPDIEYKKYNGLAKIYLKEGRTREAVRLLQKSIENYPYDDEARTLLATLPRDPADAPAPPPVPAPPPRP